MISSDKAGVQFPDSEFLFCQTGVPWLAKFVRIEQPPDIFLSSNTVNRTSRTKSGNIKPQSKQKQGTITRKISDDSINQEPAHLQHPTRLPR